MVTSLGLRHPTFPDAPAQVVAEEDQALGKAEADQEHPQALDLQVLGRRAFATTSREGSAIGEISASIFTKLDRHRHNHAKSTSPACFGRRANAIKETSACSGTMVLLVSRAAHQGHQATRPLVQPHLLRMVSQGRLLPSRGRSRSKDKTRTAACCLSYAMAAPTKRQVRVNPKPHVRHIGIEGKGSPHLTKQRRYSTVYVDSSHCPKPDRRDTIQAIEATKELEAIVMASLNDANVLCNFECSDFGLTCQHCEKLHQLSCAAHNAGLEFLADTGSEEDLISGSDHELYYSESASKHVSLMTANGSIQGDRSVTLSMPMIGQTAECYVLESTPSVCSVGRRCMDEGFEFHWYPGQPPYFIAPDGRKHRCKMRGRVPVIGGEGSTALRITGNPAFSTPSAETPTWKKQLIRCHLFRCQGNNLQRTDGPHARDITFSLLDTSPKHVGLLRQGIQGATFVLHGSLRMGPGRR